MKYLITILMMTASLYTLAETYEVKVKINSDRLSYLVTIINNSPKDIWCKGLVKIFADKTYVDGFADEVDPNSIFYMAFTSPAPIGMTSITHEIKCEEF